MNDEISPTKPHNLNAERAILGALILFCAEIALKVFPFLKEEHLFVSPHRIILRHIQLLWSRNRNPDLVTLSESLRTTNELENAGGDAYLSQLVDGVPRNSNVAHHVEIVLELAQRCALIDFAEAIQISAFNGEEPSGDILERGIAQLLAIPQNANGSVGARSWAQVSKSVVDHLKDAKMNPAAHSRIKFGFKDVDAIATLARKELCLVVAPTSNGKTLFGAQTGVVASADGFKTIFYSAEMAAEDIAVRELAYRAGVKFYYTQRPESLHEDELERISRAAEEEVLIDVVDQDVTPTKIWAMSEAAKRTRGLDLIIVDYDQLVIEAEVERGQRRSGARADDDIFRKQRAFVIGLKNLAKRLDIAVILLAQLRKIPANVERGAKPRLDDIWGDSSMRNTPQLIMWLKRDYFEHGMDPDFERVAHLYVLKGRNGRTGVVELDFDPERVRFSDATTPEVHVP